MRFHPPMRAQFSHSHGFYILTRTGVGLGSFSPLFFFFFYAQNTGNILTRRSLCTETRVDRNPGGVVRNSVAEEWKYVLRIFPPPRVVICELFFEKETLNYFRSFFERILSRDRLLFERASFDRINKKRKRKEIPSLRRGIQNSSLQNSFVNPPPRLFNRLLPSTSTRHGIPQIGKNNAPISACHANCFSRRVIPLLFLFPRFCKGICIERMTTVAQRAKENNSRLAMLNRYICMYAPCVYTA